MLSDDVRVVKPLKDEDSGNAGLEDVKHDGNDVGEVVMRGNTVMKEVSKELYSLFRRGYRSRHFRSISMIQKRHAKPSAVVTSIQAISLSCTRMETFLFGIAARTLSSPVERYVYLLPERRTASSTNTS